MFYFKPFFHRLVRNPEESLFRRVLLIPLAVLSIFYGLAVSLRLFFYQKGICKAHALPCKVVSVGNITLGGTGKTPFVCLLAAMIRKRGYRTAVLSRGYKGTYHGPYALVSDGERILLDALQAGDEPCLLARKLPGIPVIVGRERRVSGRLAVERFKSEVLILDDGFQHLALKRDVNFLLLDSSSPFGNGRLFPRGELREPLPEAGRAEAVVLTKAEEPDSIYNIMKTFTNLPGERPFFRIRYRPEKIRPWGEEKAFPPEALGKKRVWAFSALARPESFEKTLKSLGPELLGFEVFPDHHHFRRKDLDRMIHRAVRAGAETLLTTEKDGVRITEFPAGALPLWVLAVEQEFLEGDLSRFEEFLFGRLGGE